MKRLAQLAQLLTLVGSAAIAALSAAPAASAQQVSPQEALLMEDAVRARNLAMAVQIYNHQHESLPPDLAALAPYLGATNEQVAARLISTRIDPPARVGDLAAWLDEHASFVYLGLADAPLDEITDWDRTVIGYLRLDLAHPVHAEPGDPEGAVVPLAFLDGHVATYPPDEAAALIEESRQVYIGLATGGPLPDFRQAQWNLRRLSEALAGYARAHDGLLPPDLAVLLDYIPDGPGAATPQEKARAFLSPRAARSTAIPEQPTIDWIRQHSTWVYRAAAADAHAAVQLAMIEDPGATILIHGRLTDTLERPGDDRRLVPFATASGNTEAVSRELAAWRIEQSRKVIEFARDPGEATLPDLQHTMRDLRLLGEALQRYTQLSDGALPAHLSDLYEFVEDPHRPLSPAQTAAIFLSPRAERLLAIPDTPPIPQWLAERANYTLVRRDEAAADFSSHAPPILIHQPLDEPLSVRTEGGDMPVITALDASGQIRTFPAESAPDWIAGRI